ncbi:MAG: hypothetical protein HY665_02890 [Chloroflexi bacterium]|nr:hypothetical protein [Chloroflexota bacterium]
MITLGIDAGTRTTKAVVSNDHRILASAIVACGKESTASSAELARRAVLTRANLLNDGVAKIAATGLYGDRVPFATHHFSEGACLARGMYQLNPAVHSVLDVGSVRVLAIKCHDGKLTGIAVNDRCATGTGSFIEVLAGFFRIPIDKLDEVAQKASGPVEFLNTCAVYIESEVLSLLVTGKKTEDLIAGALRGFASRLLATLISIGIEPDVAMAGGLARSRTVVKAIEENLGLPLYVPQEPETVMALGAALLAEERA